MIKLLFNKFILLISIKLFLLKIFFHIIYKKYIFLL